MSQMLDLMTDDLVTYRADPDGATFHGKEGFLGTIEGEFWFVFEVS